MTCNLKSCASMSLTGVFAAGLIVFFQWFLPCLYHAISLAGVFAARPLRIFQWFLFQAESQERCCSYFQGCALKRSASILAPLLGFLYPTLDFLCAT